MASALKQISSERPTLQDLERAMEEIQNDHPRSAAIVGATYLDDVTRLAILTKLVDLSKDETDRLFVGFAPLSSFSAKIQMAYAMGLIGKKTRHDLKTIRDIRNVFAHASVSVTFETEAVANAINGLHFGKLSEAWNELSAQRKFAAVVNAIMIYMIALWSRVKPTEMTIIRSFDIPAEIGPIKFED